jgi:hypothetical protein
MERVLVTDCELLKLTVIVKKESLNPIQNLLLLVTEPRTRDNTLACNIFVAQQAVLLISL